MTCIIGLVHGGVVYMAGDSAEQTDNERWDCQPKVWRVGEFLLGSSAGTSRAWGLARYCFTPPLIDPDSGKDLMEYMVAEFVPALRTALRDGGHTKVDSNKEETELQMLVGVRGRLFTVWSDYSVSEALNRPFQAVGCGAPYALGWLAAWERMGVVGQDVPSFLVRAIDVASQFAPAVGGHVTVLVGEGGDAVRA